MKPLLIITLLLAAGCGWTAEEVSRGKAVVAQIRGEPLRAVLARYPELEPLAKDVTLQLYWNRAPLLRGSAERAWCPSPGERHKGWPSLAGLNEIQSRKVVREMCLWPGEIGRRVR